MREHYEISGNMESIHFPLILSFLNTSLKYTQYSAKRWLVTNAIHARRTVLFTSTMVRLFSNLNANTLKDLMINSQAN